MRLFVALDIDEAIRQRICVFMDGMQGFAPEMRWVRPESLHVTLKFIGEKPAETAAEIQQKLSTIQGGKFELGFRGHGFFPSAKAARVFWIGIEGDGRLASLAKAVDQVMAGMGIPVEDHEYSPHLTLARTGRGSGAPRQLKADAPQGRLRRLQERLAAMRALEFGTMTAREFFLYQSQLMRSGSRYTKIARFALE